MSNEPQGEILETKVSKAAKEKKPATEKRSAHPLSWINLVLMLVLIAIMGFAVWMGWQQQQSTTAEVAVLRDHLNTALQTLDQTSARENELMGRAESLSKSSQQLQEQVAHNTDRLGKLPGAERQDWLLAEAEYLLRLANQRLQLERDWDGALSMLSAADNVLLETRNPRMDKVRALIAREILALRAVPAIDRVGAILRIQALQEQVTSLPWMPEKLIAEPQTQDVAPIPLEEQTWYWNAWRYVKDNVTRMVRIRERTAPIAAPLTPDQQYYLQQNMRLMLEQAQVALLREQTDLYQHSLKRVHQWLDEYLMMSDERTRAAYAALTELQAWNAAPARPDISASLLELQTLVEQQRRGTVVPAAAVKAEEGTE